MKNCLRELRTARGWSQAALADALGVSRQSVNAIETGRYDPSLSLAFRIARLFELPIDRIFDDGESPELGESAPAKRRKPAPRRMTRR